MIEFVWPQTNGEWWAWSSALFLLLSGLWAFIRPHGYLSFVGLLINDNKSQGLAEIRGPLGGGSIGLAIAVMVLHPQPLLYLALGSVYFFSAIGRMVSMVIDRGNVRYNWVVLVFEFVLASSPIAYALGYLT